MLKINFFYPAKKWNYEPSRTQTSPVQSPAQSSRAQVSKAEPSQPQPSRASLIRPTLDICSFAQAPA